MEQKIEIPLTNRGTEKLLAARVRAWRYGLRFLIIIANIFVSGCHFLSPRDMSPFNMITDRKALKNLTGVWSATSETYDLMKREKYKSDSVKLTLKSDSTFEATNIPDCISEGFGNPVRNLLVPVTGKWSLVQFKGEWKMRMEFDRGQLFKDNSVFDFDLYHSGKAILMSIYVGDPDEVKVLEFKKDNLL